MPPLAALGIQAPQPESPIDSLTKVYSLSGMLQAQAAQRQQMRANELGLQSKQIELENEKMAQADQKGLTDAFVASGGDWTKALDMAAQKGVRAQTIMSAKTALLKQQADLVKMSSDQLDNVKKKTDLLGNAASAALTAPPEQRRAIVAEQMKGLVAAGLLSPDQAQAQWNQLGTLDDAGLEQFLKVHSLQAVSAKDQIDQELRTREANFKEQEFAAKMPGGPMSPVEQKELDAYKQNPRIDPKLHAAGQKDAATFLQWKAKQSPFAMVQGNLLTPEATAALGEKFTKTGELPAGLSRSPGTTAAVINTGVKGAPTADLAANKATFQADASSLKKLQAQFDAVSGFERTAGNNLDVFLEQANNLTDSGVKLLNVPMRKIQRNMLGTADLAAFDAARTTALTEIAKVLNSPTGSGVVSDSARHEVEGLIGENATLAAIIKAAGILKRDMANRHRSYQEQIDQIKARLGAGSSGAAPGATPPAAGGGDFFSQFGGKARQH